MAKSYTHPCPQCQQLQADLQATQADLRATQARVAQLEAKLAKARKHSQNSSKPPSSDITNPPKTKPKKNHKRTRGGQRGHPRHERLQIPPEQIDQILDYQHDACPCCHGPLQQTHDEAKILQHIELSEAPVVVTEHRRLAQYCAHCDKTYHCPWPEHLVKAGLVGLKLTALVGFLKGPCHMSYSTIRKYFRDVLGVPISRGLLAKVIGKVSASLHDPYEELLRALPEEAYLNVDETGHKDNGSRMWTWCFRASLYTLFKISPSRGSQVLVDVLGEEFDGLLGCDYFSAYRKDMKDFGVPLPFCLAHFIRDVKFLVEHPHADNREHGQVLLGHLRKLFSILHRRDSYASEATFQRALERVRDDLVYDGIMSSPGTREADNLGDRFVEHFDSYFRFITTPGVEPTNNLAEQAIRFVAIHRRLTQGTRSESGQSWCERIWTVIQSCAQQGRSVFSFLVSAVESAFRGEPAPSLLPDTS